MSSHDPGLDKESVRRSAKASTEHGSLTLTYYEAGPAEPTGIGGDLPLVMLHGGGPGASSWSNFGPALPRFASSFRTLLVDQPGFGGSDKPDVVGNYYRHAADYVVRLLDELGIERVHLLGNSLGGGTAMRLTLSHPDRVGRLGAADRCCHGGCHSAAPGLSPGERWQATVAGEQ